MKNKNLLLGLGMGLIISSLLFYIGINITNYSNSNINDDYVIERASKLGMVFNDDPKQNNENKTENNNNAVSYNDLISNDYLVNSDNTNEVPDSLEDTVVESDVNEIDVDNNLDVDLATISVPEPEPTPTVKPTASPTPVPTPVTTPVPTVEPIVSPTQTTEEVSINNEDYVFVNIPRNSSVSDVSAILKNTGLIGDAAAFVNFVNEYYPNSTVKFGNFLIPKNANNDQLVKILLS